MNDSNDLFSISKMMERVDNTLRPYLRQLCRMYFEACTVAACEAGELSEVEAARSLRVDVVDYRGIRINVISSVCPNYDLKNSLTTSPSIAGK